MGFVVWVSGFTVFKGFVFGFGVSGSRLGGVLCFDFRVYGFRFEVFGGLWLIRPVGNFGFCFRIPALKLQGFWAFPASGFGLYFRV